MTSALSRPRAAIILAAGRSTRMKSAMSKVLHPLGGRPLLGWVAAYARAAGCERVICVVGPMNADVRDYAESLNMEIAVQDEQLGTAHAVLAAREALAGFEGDLVVLYGDTPMLRPETVSGVFDQLAKADVCVLGFEPEGAHAYGRLIEVDGQLQAIVEHRDATPAQRAVKLCNSGVMAADAAAMMEALDAVGNDNAKGEYYLTDLVAIFRGRGGTAKAVRAEAGEVMGIDSRPDLATAHTVFQDNMRKIALEEGVTLRAPETVFFSFDTVIERDAVIGENVVFGPGAVVRGGATVHAFCHIEGAEVGVGATIGPFARLRPGTVLGEGAKIGNFVETKNADIGAGAKVNHLTYIGDAELGADANVGAGTITCNYDGFAKHKTVVGAGAFVGSNSSLVAPVEVGAGAYVGSGSVVTKDVPGDALYLARSQAVVKDGWAARFRSAMRKKLS